MEAKLARLQERVSLRFGCKVDVYRQEGKGVLVVQHGNPLEPVNIIFVLSEFELSLF